MKMLAAGLAVLVLGLAGGYEHGQHQLAQRERAAAKRAEVRRVERAHARGQMRAHVCKYWPALCPGGAYIGHSRPRPVGIWGDWPTG